MQQQEMKQRPVVNIGSRRQLFLDDYIVERMEDVEKIFHPAIQHTQPVIVADTPWEKGGFLGSIGNCVFYDEADEVYRLYYVAYQVKPDLSEILHNVLALSKDGLHWEKPNLGIAMYKGSGDNNLLFDYDSPRRTNHWWVYNNVFRDEHDPDPSRRYKALGHGIFNYRSSTDRRVGVIVAYSPDGLHWTEPPENPVLPNADTHTVLGWDESIQKYVAYPRTGVRSIGYSVSEDFIHWSEPRTVMARGPDDPPHYQIYGMPVFQYEGLYVGFPWSFIAADWEPLDTQLAVSRDGQQWQKVGDGRKFVPLGPPGAFDDCYAICTPPVRVGDELFFYYMGAGFPHGSQQYVRQKKREGSIGLARLRIDGFVSLASRFDSGGIVTTCAFRFSGRHLLVNCNCPRGWIRVELQDADGAPVSGFSEEECDPICTDSVRHVVTWKGKDDVSGLTGIPVRVTFRIADGELFSFGFAEALEPEPDGGG